MSTSPAKPADQPHAKRDGVLYGLAAHTVWGMVPAYYKTMAHIPSLEMLAHRILWSPLILLPVVLRQRRFGAIWQAVRTPLALGAMLLATLLIATNWFVLIWAIQNKQILGTSLGYFMTPLVNAAMGMTLLRERMRPWQAVSVVLAAVGIAYFVWATGQLPWVSLLLAGSFGCYGWVRKVSPVGALEGLTFETLVLTPAALGYLIYLGAIGEGAFLRGSITQDLLLVFAGVITATPLLWFAKAARRVTLTTLGFLQYVGPTGHFLMGMIYGEAFTPNHAVMFACIWTALAIYTTDSLRAARARHARGGEGPARDTSAGS